MGVTTKGSKSRNWQKWVYLRREIIDRSERVANCCFSFRTFLYCFKYNLLRNLYIGQEATVRTEHGTTDWIQTGKGVCQGCKLSPYLFNLYAEYIMWNVGLDEAQAGIKIAGRDINDLQIHRWHYPHGRKWRGTKEPLDESEKGEWKIWLKLNIQKTKIMASGPITSWQIDGDTWKQ